MADYPTQDVGFTRVKKGKAKEVKIEKAPLTGGDLVVSALPSPLLFLLNDKMTKKEQQEKKETTPSISEFVKSVGRKDSNMKKNRALQSMNRDEFQNITEMHEDRPNRALSAMSPPKAEVKQMNSIIPAQHQEVPKDAKPFPIEHLEKMVPSKKDKEDILDKQVDTVAKEQGVSISKKDKEKAVKIGVSEKAIASIQTKVDEGKKVSFLEQLGMGIGMMLPQILGAAVGSAFGGDEGLIAGAQAGAEVQKQHLDQIRADKERQEDLALQDRQVTLAELKEQISVKNKESDDIFRREKFEFDKQMETEKLMQNRAKVEQSPFFASLDKKHVDEYVGAQTSLQDIGQNMSLLEQAIDRQLKYSTGFSGFMGGTGPIATGLGFKRHFSQELEGLHQTFQEISLNKMVKMFDGMSKAVDSNAERKAFESTQPNIKNDDKTNLQILYGSKVALAKEKAIADDMARYLQEHGHLRGFHESNAILRGDTASILDKMGNVRIVPKSSVKELERSGHYFTTDRFIDKIEELKYKLPGQHKAEKEKKGEWTQGGSNRQLYEEEAKRRGLI